MQGLFLDSLFCSIDLCVFLCHSNSSYIVIDLGETLMKLCPSPQTQNVIQFQEVWTSLIDILGNPKKLVKKFKCSLCQAKDHSSETGILA